MKHRSHIGDVAGIPATDILVESPGHIEHSSHISDVAGVPTADILVESESMRKHHAHVGDVACVPIPDVLIEGVGPGEHVVHVSDIACVPMPDVLIEVVSVAEHAAHVGDVGQIGRICPHTSQMPAALKRVSHGCPFARPPLFNRQQLEAITPIMKVNPGETRLPPRVVFDADGVDAGAGVVAGGVARRAGDVIHAIIVAIDVVVVAVAGGGNGELGGARFAGNIGPDGDDEIGGGPAQGWFGHGASRPRRPCQ